MAKIRKVSAIYGFGDALNARSFLVEYCKQKCIDPGKIYIYTNKYWWLFKDLGFSRSVNDKEFKNLTPFNNFGLYDMPKVYKIAKLDDCIAKNAGINYSFDTITPFPEFPPVDISLPNRYITINTGYGEFSGKAGNNDYVCTKSWPIPYWERLVKLLGVPCVQIGAGNSCNPVKGTLNLIDKTSLQETATILRGSLFHIDIEGGLTIFKQHLGGKSVVLFGPTAIENQGRSFNLNLCANTCQPCYEWGTHKYPLCVRKDKLLCNAHCMTDLKPEYVAEKIFNSKWLTK